jgi:hypothetical protein
MCRICFKLPRFGLNKRHFGSETFISVTNPDLDPKKVSFHFTVPSSMKTCVKLAHEVSGSGTLLQI